MTTRDRLKALLFGFAFAILLLSGACDLNRPPPNPGGYGGWFATGGTPSLGGSAGFGASNEGGAAAGHPGAETGGAVAVDWPECAPPTQKARPVVRHQLGRKQGAITKRVKASYVVLDLPSVSWAPLLPALDQKSVGACTGFAVLQCRLSAPWAWAGAVEIEALNRIALDIYSGATKRDPWPGAWPPTDTGSNGESALSVAVEKGIFASYVRVNSFEELQYALQYGPCITGTDWPDGFFAPNSCGWVSATGPIAGGHEWVISGIRFDTKEILGRTSWDFFGREWHGKSGFFRVKFGDYTNLLNAGGDIHCPRVANDNATQIREAG